MVHCRVKCIPERGFASPWEPWDCNKATPNSQGVCQLDWVKTVFAAIRRSSDVLKNLTHKPDN